MALQWREPPAAELAAVELFDKFANHRNKLRILADKAAEYAGLPCSIEGEHMVVDPSYRWAHVFERPKAKPDPDEAGVVFRNQWWSTRLRKVVCVWQEADGRYLGAAVPSEHSAFELGLRTLVCSVAWGIEQESKALQLLATLVQHHTFKHYLLTGMFLETSARSQVTYCFRKLRPTVAMSMRGDSPKILATLCMHPIAYYEASFAGAMCPTDDVIAHLMLMRGDEAMFWRRCNQHPADRPQSALGA